MTYTALLNARDSPTPQIASSQQVSMSLTSAPHSFDGLTSAPKPAYISFEQLPCPQDAHQLSSISSKTDGFSGIQATLDDNTIGHSSMHDNNGQELQIYQDFDVQEQAFLSHGGQDPSRYAEQAWEGEQQLIQQCHCDSHEQQKQQRSSVTAQEYTAIRRPLLSPLVPRINFNPARVQLDYGRCAPEWRLSRHSVSSLFDLHAGAKSPVALDVRQWYDALSQCKPCQSSTRVGHSRQHGAPNQPTSCRSEHQSLKQAIHQPHFVHRHSPSEPSDDAIDVSAFKSSCHYCSLNDSGEHFSIWDTDNCSRESRLAANAFVSSRDHLFYSRPPPFEPQLGACSKIAVIDPCTALAIASSPSFIEPRNFVSTILPAGANDSLQPSFLHHLGEHDQGCRQRQTCQACFRCLVYYPHEQQKDRKRRRPQQHPGKLETINSDGQISSGNKMEKRVRVACQFCNRRKIRCDGIVPCMHCERRGIECVYPAGGRCQ